MDGAHCASIFDQLAALFDRDLLTAPAVKAWPLEQVADAYQAVQDGSAGIRQVLLPVGGEA
jgi:NADPH:quinone reductase